MNDIDDFRDIVLKNRPLLDVRADVEFKEGAFLNSTNLPLLNDEERRQIGIRYKEAGNEKAVELGERLVGPFKDERVEKWVEFIKDNPSAYLYCFRGGQRSKIVQEWLGDKGVNVSRLKGGYKAFRSFLMSESERVSEELNTFIIGGRTGSGKTIVLNKFENSIDLEALANHRGSSFGKQIDEQPSQINFENNLAYELIQHDENKPLIIEHESGNVGRLYIPKKVYANLMSGGLILLETSMQTRVDITYDEYVKKAIKKHKDIFGDEGEKIWFENANSSLDRIQKRLGSKRHLWIKKVFQDAYESSNIEENKVWIRELLDGYYDKMYDYQISKSSMPVVYRGNMEEVAEYLKMLP